MSKPQPRSTKVVTYNKILRSILFYADRNIVEDFMNFGKLGVQDKTDLYMTFVHPRYDFDEVLAYIRDYEPSPTNDTSEEI